MDHCFSEARQARSVSLRRRYDLAGVEDAVGVEGVLEGAHQRQLLGRAGVAEVVELLGADAVLGRDGAADARAPGRRPPPRSPPCGCGSRPGTWASRGCCRRRCDRNSGRWRRGQRASTAWRQAVDVVVHALDGRPMSKPVIGPMHRGRIRRRRRGRPEVADLAPTVWATTASSRMPCLQRAAEQGLERARRRRCSVPWASSST